MLFTNVTKYTERKQQDIEALDGNYSMKKETNSFDRRIIMDIANIYIYSPH